ncbi:MAG: serine/threonine-protein phosphatase [Planctomycetes bacterium]|nr:serine/threonine-protein phosphatase [Planctomycetota bacterium]
MADDTFMSLALCRLGSDGSASYVAAGHEPPLIHRAAGDHDVLDSTGLLLGLLADERYESQGLPPLVPGDLLVLYTDGMWECQAPDGEQFGVQRMRDAVARHAAGGAPAVRDALVAGALAHLAGKPPLDDMTVVVAERVTG